MNERRDTGREILAIIIVVIVGLVLLGVVWRVVRALLWLLAALLLAFLIYVAWREKQRSGSWASGVSASGRALGSMARGLGRMFGGGKRDDEGDGQRY